MSETLDALGVLSPAPILEAVERYRGTMVDLDTSRVFSPDDFARTREVLLAALAAQGVLSGDRVIVAVTNGPLFVAALTALLACEASPLLLHCKTPPAELHRYAQRFGARWLLADAGDEAALAEVTCAGGQLALGDAGALHLAVFAGVETGFSGPTLRGVPLHPTSGSTGLPKIALRPGLAALEEARHYAATMAIDSDDCILAIPPMSHAYGYGMCVMVPLLTGASIISTRKFSVKLIHRALGEFPVTILPTVPAMLDVLSFGRRADLTRMRWVLTAGALLPARAAEQFHDKTGVTACSLYGTTETGGISVATAADGRDVDGRVGPPMSGVEIDVRLDESSTNDGPGIGKLHVRSSSLMTGYLDENGNLSAPLPGGWFETGDLARIDDDGSIHLRGRHSELINVSGLKVVPCEVEESIAGLPGVVEVRVYAGEHRSGTQIVKAAVAAENGLTETAIRAHCEQHLVYYKRPQVVTLVDALPRTPTGKIDHARLP